MSTGSRLLAFFGGQDERHGPLPALFLLLTVVTGLVDAVSYLRLGHVFVANMTGNVVFLGFAVADARDFSIPASLTAIAGFLAGAAGGGRLGAALAHKPGRYVATVSAIKVALVAAALIVALGVAGLGTTASRYALIVLLAVTMGLQNAMARRLSIPDLTTTVLTMTLTGLAADSRLAHGGGQKPARRLLAVGAMLLGAAVGAFLVLRNGVVIPLALALALLGLAGIMAARYATPKKM